MMKSTLKTVTVSALLWTIQNYSHFSLLTSDFGCHSNYYAMDFITKLNHNVKAKYMDEYI